MARPAVLLLALLLVPAAAGAEFQATASFEPFPPETSLAFLSGSLEARLSGEAGAYGFMELREDLAVTGVTRICGDTVTCAPVSGSYTLVVQAGGAAGLHFPGLTSGTARAQHAIAFTADLSGVHRGQLSGRSDFRLGPSLLALTVGGTHDFGAIPAVPETVLTPTSGPEEAAGLAGLTDDTVITIYQGTQVLQTLKGKQALAFQGHPAIGTVAANGLLLPFAGASTLAMERAAAEDAARGLDLDGLGASIDRMQLALTGQKQDPVALDLGPLNDVADKVLNGAFVHFPTQGTGPSDVLPKMELVRFESLAGRSADGSLALSGEAPLAIQGGRVQGAEGLAGFSYLQMPWWSWLLWALAIAAFVTRLVLKSPKQHPKWDRLRWVGWTATIVLLIALVWLWDRRFGDVFGVSLFGGAGGDTFLPVLLVEFGTLSLVLFAVVTPLRILLRNGFRIAKQGTFMGLAGPLALLGGILLGGGLLLSYLDLVLQAVGGA